MRSRNLEISDPNGDIVDPDTGEHWRLLDLRADLDRIARQQSFIRKLAGLAISKSLSDPFLAVDLADNVLEYVKADQGLSRGDVNALIRAFQTVDVNDPNSVRFETLPVEPYQPDPNRLDRLCRRRRGGRAAAHVRRQHAEAGDGAAVAGEGAGHRRHRHQRRAVGGGAARRAWVPGDRGARRRRAKVDVTEIRYGYGQSEEAKALLPYFPDAKLVPDPKVTGAVQLVLGTSFPGAITVPSTTTTAPPSTVPGAPVTTAPPPTTTTWHRRSRPLPLSGGPAARSERPVHFRAVRILVTGAAGQVGARVVEALAGHDVLAAARDTLDLADREQVEQVVAEFAPDAVVNAAAMTNVDGCERDPEQAFAVNALGVRTLAQAAARRGAHLVHVSTDYVFDGARDAALRRVGRGAPDLGVRPLEARRRARGRAATPARGRPSAPRGCSGGGAPTS